MPNTMFVNMLKWVSLHLHFDTHTSIPGWVHLAEGGTQSNVHEQSFVFATCFSAYQAHGQPRRPSSRGAGEPGAMGWFGHQNSDIFVLHHPKRKLRCNCHGLWVYPHTPSIDLQRHAALFETCPGYLRRPPGTQFCGSSLPTLLWSASASSTYIVVLIPLDWVISMRSVRVLWCLRWNSTPLLLSASGLGDAALNRTIDELFAVEFDAQRMCATVS